MGESVTYADLRFSKAPQGWSMTPRVQASAPPVPDEADDTYENLQLGPVGEGPAGHGAQRHREPLWRAQPLPLGLLAACLVLLTTTIALGVCYWQEGQQLQQASHAHTAEREGLLQQVGTQEKRLGQTGAALALAHDQLKKAQEALRQTQEERDRSREELHGRDTELQEMRVKLKSAKVELQQTTEVLREIRVELAQARQDMNHRQEELQKSRAELLETRSELKRAQEQAHNLQQQLDKAVRAQASLWPSLVTDCCPEAWVLYGGKCLFLSKQEKTWDQSKQECQRKKSQLLNPQDWDHTTMESFLGHTDIPYWIRLWKTWVSKNSLQKWQWEDSTTYSWPESTKFYVYYGIIKGSSIESTGRYAENRWICEQSTSCPQGATRMNPVP
ncbi:B-cell differentiation antigen CD72 [Alligator mississippiensis]|uniref:B-cell differentiation antigen CD72 n=1 Tax=Alligator mississippiensis TaxID=8496 RepID=A0A151M7P6_ALLMI|nr:B-cell differentiation antigen CD72 [Alligator mississippiensis]